MFDLNHRHLNKNMLGTIVRCYYHLGHNNHKHLNKEQRVISYDDRQYSLIVLLQGGTSVRESTLNGYKKGTSLKACQTFRRRSWKR